MAAEPNNRSNEDTAVIKDWLSRDEGTARPVRLEFGGDTLEFSQASATDEERPIALFVRKHTTGKTVS